MSKGHLPRFHKIDLTWRGDKTLPWIYGFFFMLASFFIGEVLPVVISIFAGVFGTYGSKLPVNRSLPDLGIVLIIYSIFGLLFWLLYRFINWKIVAGFALILAFILERYVYWQVEGSINIANTISFGTIINGVIVYLLVLVLPYHIFQVIRRKWGTGGSVILVLILLALNLLGLGFTYYYMVKTDWWSNYGRQNQSSPASLLTPNTCPERLTVEKDKQTTAYWNGKTFSVSAEVQNWVEENCPEALENAKQP